MTSQVAPSFANERRARRQASREGGRPDKFGRALKGRARRGWATVAGTPGLRRRRGEEVLSGPLKGAKMTTANRMREASLQASAPFSIQLSQGRSFG